MAVTNLVHVDVKLGVYQVHLSGVGADTRSKTMNSRTFEYLGDFVKDILLHKVGNNAL